MRGGDSLPRPAAAPPITPRPIPGSSRDPRAVVGAYLGLTAEVLRVPMTEMQWSVTVSGCSAPLPTALPAPALHGGHLEGWLLPSKGWPRFNSLRPCRAPDCPFYPNPPLPGVRGQQHRVSAFSPVLGGVRESHSLTPSLPPSTQAAPALLEAS